MQQGKVKELENPYLPIKSRITKIIEETPNIKTFRIEPQEEFSFQAGQFIQLTLPGIGEAPFTPSSSPYQKEFLEVTVMKTGRVTSLLHNIEEGESVGVRGPYGIAYPISDFYGREILIVGGGVGFAPLRSLLLALFYEVDKFKKVVLRYGARTPQDIVYKYLLDEWRRIRNLDMVLTVDKGDDTWSGNVGVVTTILGNLPLDSKKSIACVCGPPIMMRFTVLKLLDLGFTEDNIFLSMEKNMSCGLGKCGHCRLGRFFVCKDGPVFKYSVIKNYHDLWG